MAEIRANGVSEEFLKKVKQACLDRGLSIREATIEAFGAWAGAPPATSAPRYSKETQHLHDALDRILESSHRKSIIDVLASFDGTVGEAAGPRKSERSRKAVNE